MLLKDLNQNSIRGAGVAHGLVFAVIAFAPDMVDREPLSVLEAEWLRVFVAAIASIVAVVLAETGSRRAKMWLLYGPIRMPMPARTAFTELGPRDPRVDMRRIREVLGEIPTDPDEQDRIWFQYYKIHESNPRVRAVHGRFLLMRDLAWMTALLVPLAPLAMWGVTGSAHRALGYASALLLATGILIFSAQQRHYAFITTVLTCIGDPERKE